MMTSKIILLFLFVLSLGIDIAKHGETKGCQTFLNDGPQSNI